MLKLGIKNLVCISLVVFALSSCDGLFKIDNYDGPNAEVTGGIYDEVTGQLVETDIRNGSNMQYQELGYPPGPMNRVIKQDGTYADLLFFAGKYSVDFKNCNFFPFFVPEIEVKKGKNVLDYRVTPYIRLRNVNIRREGNAIVATFNLEAGKSEVRLSNVTLYASTDMYVGDQYTGSYVYAPRGSAVQSFSPVKVIDPAETYTLRIDLTDATNAAYFFKYTTVRNFYFRVGAIATVPGVPNLGTIRRNYAPYTIIPLSK